jgi:hypothetical protein
VSNDEHVESTVRYGTDVSSSDDDRKRAHIAFCLSKLNIKTLPSYRILKENFPNVTESHADAPDDHDQEEYLAWKKYLMVRIESCRRERAALTSSSLSCLQPVLVDIERRLKSNDLNSSRRLSSSTSVKRKHDR